MGERTDAILRGLRGTPDLIGTMASQAAWQPLAGLGGLAELVRSGGDSDAAARRIEQIQSNAYTPRTPEGQQMLGDIGRGVDWVGEKLGHPIQRAADKLSEVPVVGPSLAATALGFTEVADPTKVVGKAAKAAKTAERAVAKAAKSSLRQDVEKAALGYDPAEMAKRYPELGPEITKTDPKKGTSYLAREKSPEAEAVMKVREAAMKDVKAGKYQPLFDVEKRYYADPGDFPVAQRTEEVALPKKAETVAKFKERFDTPQARANLLRAYEEGSKDPNAKQWYAMGQLADAFKAELGPEEGAKQFRQRFSHPMAATTGGADPTANLLMSGYGNFLREKGMPIPEVSRDFPTPIGGRYVGGNMAMYDKVLNQGGGLSAVDQPKRHNFAANFEGHRDRSTIDEQMSGGFEPGLAAPPGASYGVMEGVVNDLAREQGVPPAEFQDVAWKGLKGVPGKPMMQHVNEAIYRTHKVTGLPQEEVLKGFIRGNMPLYGVAGAGTAGAMANLLRGQPEEQQ